MLDPFSTLSLAAAVVQFVDFGTRLMSKGKEIYQSADGSSAENIELEVIYEDLKALSDTLKATADPTFLSRGSLEERALGKLAAICKGVADELLTTLRDLRVAEGPHRKWSSFRKALKTIWKKEKIEELKNRLEGLRDELSIQFLAILRDQQSSLLLEIQTLVKESRSIDCERNEQLQKLSSDLQSARASISLAPTKEHVDRIVNKLADLAFSASEVAIELKILKGLYFDSLKARHSRISSAHKHTFEWIFKPEVSHISFVEWLRTKTGIYWISGKAGSGKSTLMKYLCDHPDTEKELTTWAGNDKLVTASCFFWNAGSSIQKSQEGLLRSLLYEVLRNCPELISEVCPSRWESAVLHVHNEDAWSLSELSDTIAILKKQGTAARKFCFFVDGLDEYDGDHRAIIKVLNNFTASPNIKICLSSRPWNVFEDVYGQSSSWKLYLQDLTREDIRIYVESELHEHPCFSSLITEDARYQDLIQDIVKRSQGVFLWVFLVLRSLSDGLTNGDDMRTLQNRVQALPSDLEEYFTHMLRQVEGIYIETMCRTFQAALAATESLTLISYAFLDERDSNFALQLETKPFDNHDIFLAHSKMRRRINARSKGLLEVYMDPAATDFWGHRVTWLHRTVRDFFFTKDMHSMLMKYQGPHFNANLALCRAYLALLKAMPRHQQSLPDDTQNILGRLIQHAQQAELEGVEFEAGLFDNVESIVSAVSKQTGKKFFPQASFFEYAIASGLEGYVAQRLNENPSLYTSTAKPLLRIALEASAKSFGIVQMLLERGMDPNQNHRWSTIAGHWIMKACETGTIHREDFLRKLELLLSYGANPNSLHDERTLWAAYLEWISHHTRTETLDQKKRHFEVVDKLICSGANPNVCTRILMSGSIRKRRAVVHDLFPPKLVVRLQESLEKRRVKRVCSCNIFAIFWKPASTNEIRQPLLQHNRF